MIVWSGGYDEKLSQLFYAVLCTTTVYNDIHTGRLMSPDCGFGTSCLLHLTFSANSENSWKRFCLSRTRLQRLVTLTFRHRT